MSEGSFHVNHGAMDTAVDALTKATRDIDSEIRQLNQQLAVLQGTWVGAAKGVYDEKQAAWNAAVAEMVTLLAKTGTNLRQIGHNYVRADNNAAMTWTQV